MLVLEVNLAAASVAGGQRVWESRLPNDQTLEKGRS
jgi:hypothetical protein